MDSQLCIFTLFLWNLGYQESHRTYFFVLFLFPFLCSSCNITLIISTVKRWVLIILWRICEHYEPCKMVKKDALLVYLQRRLFLLFYRATALQRGNSFPSCAWRNILFRTRFSWFDHIFTTNSWKNIFVWFSYHILRQRLMVYTTYSSFDILIFLHKFLFFIWYYDYIFKM